MIIKLKINVKNIEKGRLYVGAKGTYLDCTLLENNNGQDQYGNHFIIVQDVSKDDRAAGIKGAILGNGKIVEPKNAPRKSSAIDGTDYPAHLAQETDDVLF